jgi:hypothetical protein
MNKYKIELKWAVIFSLMSLVWILFESLTGLHDTHIDKHPVYTNLFAIPAIIIYVLALIDKRKNFYQGVMTYKQGFVAGLIITLIITLLSPVVQIISLTIIAPDYFRNVIEYSVSEGMMNREEAENYFNLTSYILQALIFAPVMGIITTAIVAIFTKKTVS